MKNPSGHPDKFRGSRGPDKSDMRKACEAAGMSRHQMYQALQVASVPRDEFERLVESADPPSITDLARIGRGAQSKPKQSTWDRLVRAWNAASDDDRARLWAEVSTDGS